MTPDEELRERIAELRAYDPDVSPLSVVQAAADALERLLEPISAEETQAAVTAFVKKYPEELVRQTGAIGFALQAARAELIKKILEYDAE